MSDHDIAIIGMSGRFPGAPDLATYWHNLRNGIESIRPLTDEELLARGVSASMLADPEYVKVCPVLEDVEQFDPGFFGLSPRDAAVMDPAHRLFLEVAWEAMEHAGHTGLPDAATVGVFAGSGASYYLMDHIRRNKRLLRSLGEFLARHTNNDMNFLSSRVSYEMDLRGPSINVQTACSTALVSVHMACESIRRGECTMALAGGATVLIPHAHGYQYHEGEILSPDGHCRPFDSESAGTVFGSGVGCLVLKRLSAALDDGDTVHAVIKGSAVNNDGALRVGFLAPGVDGQAAVVARALDDAHVSADSISYIETHGTGTLVGDPIEVTALNQAYAERTRRRGFCAIGSVKSNIGHLGEAAGAASLIKAVLALVHRELPPSLGYRSPNPQIDFENSPFFVNDRLRAWVADGPRRCGVTALGAGGTNCHIILEEAPAAIAGEGERAAQLVVLSAKSGPALERARAQLAQAIEDDASLDLADASYTLAVGRRAMPHRYAVVVRDHADAVAQLRATPSKGSVQQAAESRGVVFMFPGGGAQYPGMGADLYAQEPVFRDAADACLRIANAALGRDLGALMFPPPEQHAEAAAALERPTLTLPALFTTEYALATLFHAWGVEPVAFLGHSMGEYVAACLAGVLSLDDAMRLVMVRGQLFEATERGGMLSVPLSEAELRAILPSALSIAAVNAPELCVVSGPVAAIDAFAQGLAEREIEGTRIRIEVAAHSSLLDPILDQFRRVCRSISLHAPLRPFLSNVSGTWITAAEATDPDYWVRHLRSTVRFADCVQTVRAEGERVLLEIGPGRTLSTLARAQTPAAPYSYNSMRHADETLSDVAMALATVGRAWSAGAAIDWSAFYDGQLRNRIPLPTYSWDHARYWIDAPTDHDAVDADTDGDSPRRAHVADWFARPVWRVSLPVPVATTADEHVLLFVDEQPFGTALAERLRARGRRVTTVHPGSAYSQQGDRHTVRPTVLADYEQLLTAVRGAGSLPTRVVHAWNVTVDHDVTTEWAYECGFHSMHAFAQALAIEAPDAAMVVYAVTNHAQRVGGEARLAPLKSLVLGPTRVMPREFPNVRARTVDLEVPRLHGGASPALERLVDELLHDDGVETVALRGLDRYESHMERTALTPVASRMRARGVYVITGGLGGIGFSLAQHLAATYQARLVLVGRRTGGAAARAQVHALEALGAEVELVSADIGDVSQAQRTVDRAVARFGALHGVFHVAGTLDDSLMPLKSRADAERVLAPKVQGTLALDAALRGVALDVFVLFSSISSIAGLAGQADYTAANAFLDAFAMERQTRDAALTIAINWSAWRDVGMAAAIAAQTVAGTEAPVVHPLLGRRVWSQGGNDLFASDLSTQTHWTLDEHRLREGQSLMPGTGHLEVVRAAAQARGGAGVLEIRDLNFMAALTVPDVDAREMRVHVARESDGTMRIGVGASSTAVDGSLRWKELVSARAAVLRDEAPTALDVSAIAHRCTTRLEEFAPDQSSVNMAFGPRWKNLQSIRYGVNEALVSLELPAPFRDDLRDFALHPALMDMATGRCEALVPGFNPAEDFYVPLSYTRVRVFDALPSKIVSHVRLAPSAFDPKELLVFNVTVADTDGRVLVDIEDFVMTRVTDRSLLSNGARPDASRGDGASDARFAVSATVTPLPPMVQRLDAGIRPDEGMQAIDAILAGPHLAQIFATPEPVETLLDALRQPQVVDARGKPAQAASVVTPVPDVEVALSAHEAIASCPVVTRPNRQGEPKLVAYPFFKPGARATGSELRRFLKARVAESLIPSTFVDLDASPTRSDGTVDYEALPDPFGVADDFVAPQSKTEIAIASIWKDVLGVSRVSLHDNFFDIGGHSLLAVRVIVRLDKQIGVRLTQAIMVLQTLGQIAAECDKRLAAAPAPGAAAPPPDASAGSTPNPSGLGRKLLNAFRRE